MCKFNYVRKLLRIINPKKSWFLKMHVIYALFFSFCLLVLSYEQLISQNIFRNNKLRLACTVHKKIIGAKKWIGPLNKNLFCLAIDSLICLDMPIYINTKTLKHNIF